MILTSFSNWESGETENTESGESVASSVTFDFTIRVYGGDDETVLTSLYSYLLKQLLNTMMAYLLGLFTPTSTSK